MSETLRYMSINPSLAEGEQQSMKSIAHFHRADGFSSIYVGLHSPSAHYTLRYYICRRWRQEIGLSA